MPERILPPPDDSPGACSGPSGGPCTGLSTGPCSGVPAGPAPVAPASPLPDAPLLTVFSPPGPTPAVSACPGTPSERAAPRGPIPLDLPAGLHHLCGCGRSRHGWYCDGAHLGTGRVSFELRLAQAGTVLLCGCGRSRRYPLCDGRHEQPDRRLWWRSRSGG